MQEMQSLSSTTPAYEATKKEMHALAFPETVMVLKRINIRHKRRIEEAMLQTEEGRAELLAIKLKMVKEFDAARVARARTNNHSLSEKSRIKQLKLQRAETARTLAAKKKAEQADQGRYNK